MTLSHHIMIDKVLDHPDGKLRLSIRDRSLMLSVEDARYLAAALLEQANNIDPPLETPPALELSNAYGGRVVEKADSE